MPLTSIDLTRPGALTAESVGELLASATDDIHTQLRATKTGIAFISSTDVGNANTTGLAFRLETWRAGSDHVGANSARDADWVDRVHRVLRDNWPRPSSDYIRSAMVVPVTPASDQSGPRAQCHYREG